MKTLFLILATGITVSAVIPYIRDILRGTTKPNLVSWITWTLLTGIATAAQVSAHEYIGAIFTGAAMLETLSVVLMGLRHGYVKYDRFDVVCQVAAVLGIILWQVFDSPALGVIAAVAIDLVGCVPTFRHSWKAPFEETWQTYALSGVGGAFGLAALTSYTWVSVPYPLYIVLINFLLPAVIISRRRLRAPVVS